MTTTAPISKDDIHTLSLATVSAIASAAKLAADRQRTREASVAMVRSMEAAVRQILVKSGLPAFTGLYNLGTSSVPFRGINVRSEATPSRGIEQGRGTLVLDSHGCLVIARLQGSGDERSVTVTQAADTDLQLDDLEPVAHAIRHLLGRHNDAAPTRGRHLERVGDLAHNLGIALHTWEAGRRLQKGG